MAVEALKRALCRDAVTLAVAVAVAVVAEDVDRLLLELWVGSDVIAGVGNDVIVGVGNDVIDLVVGVNPWLLDVWLVAVEVSYTGRKQIPLRFEKQTQHLL